MPIRRFVILIAQLGVAACAGRGTHAAMPPTGVSPARPSTAPTVSNAPAVSAVSAVSAASDASRAQLDSLYKSRIASARTRFSAADTRFMSGMIHHHAQAIDMARLAPSHGASASVLTLAARITNAQNDEIVLMQKWLRDRGQPLPAMHSEIAQMPGMAGMDRGSDPSMQMPGMLSPEQMRQLDAARGTEFDRLFLTFMIQHHRGAVSMVHDLFGTDGAVQDDAVFKFASDVQVDQTTEVTRMERMLATLLLRK